MTNFKKGDILVCLEDCKTCDNTNPIFKGQLVKVKDNWLSEIWFTITPFGEGNYYDNNFRLATEEEINFYNTGGNNIKDMKPKFKVGDWVVFEVEKARKLGLSNSFWCKDVVLQIDKITSYGLIFDAKKLGGDSTCGNDPRCFRKALPHEIPSQKVETQYITSIDQLQKGKWYRCKYKDTSGDYYFKFRDHQSGYINTICNGEGKGKPNTLEVSKWGNFDHCINLHEIPDPTIEKVSNQEVKSKEIVISQLVTPKVEPYKFKQQELPRLNYKIEVKKEKVTPYILKTQSLNY